MTRIRMRAALMKPLSIQRRSNGLVQEMCYMRDVSYIRKWPSRS